MTSTTDPVTLVKQKYEGLRRDMIRWRDEPKLASWGHKKRWNQALAALGEITGERAMTSLDAQAYSDRGWKRWDRVVIAIKEMEQARGHERQQRHAGSRRAPEPTDPSVSNAKPDPVMSDAKLAARQAKIDAMKKAYEENHKNDNVPDYKADYKDACKVINDLRAELSKTKQEKNTARQRLASAEKYGQRQHERAEKLESQVKTAGSVSDAAYNKLVDDYENMKDLCASQRKELYLLQGRKITFEQAIKAVMDDKIINKEIMTEGAKHLAKTDRIILRDHITDIENAMQDIATWLWDIDKVPAGLIGKNYVGKKYNQDMADMLKLIDHITYQAWQTMLVIREFGKEMEDATK